MRDPHDVILRPVLTEKAYEGFADKRYVFEVAIDADRSEIKRAVEAVFAEDGVKVEKVNTMNCKGKQKRRGMAVGYTSKTKKAIVYLTEDSKDNEIFTGL